MLDIKFIRDNQELVQEAAKKKQLKFKVADLIAVDDNRRKLLVKIEHTAPNKTLSIKSWSVPNRKKREGIDEMKILKEALQKDEEKLKEVMKHWQTLMVETPNIPDISVPSGKAFRK